ncbi:MAG: serine/threonine protein kinase, partial [Eubacterium sp.]|nr:serine/threonine protein kinase [Eubacterium sp.]
PNSIIYGDMKPHNIIITSEGFIKLIDFGISSVLRDGGTGNERGSPIQAETTFIGTKGYAAPEQYSGVGVNQATDIYSLGMTLIQLATGIDPLISIKEYWNETYKDNISTGLFKILHKCVQSNAEARYQNTAMLIKELQEISQPEAKPLRRINTESETFSFTRIIAFTGAKGAGISTITAAMAEYIARGPTSACIVDLSRSCTLEKGLAIKSNNSKKSIPSKINSNLYYINLTSQINSENEIRHNPLILSKHLSSLQEQFSYIFIDTELTVIKSIIQYISKIFLVCDMNPYNMAEFGELIASEELTYELLSGSILIINKFYQGEIGSDKIIQSLFADVPYKENIQTPFSSKIYEVPFDHRIYISWMYSFFGQPFRIADLFSEKFGSAISDIVTQTIYHKKRQKRAWFRQLLGV